MEHSEGTSLRFKKKKKNDKRRCDDNFVVAVERKASCPKSNPTKPAPSRDHFERLLDALCLHHDVPVKHMLRECRLMKNYVKGTLKPRTADQPEKGGPSPDNNNGTGVVFPR
jgi:gamma-glutamyl-gamma-aminobutyrate hydrolase PuuD